MANYLQSGRSTVSYQIFKCGDRSQVNNYRPISLLCIISKVLERIVYNHIIEFLFSSISIHQFGFVPGHSSLQQLLIFVDILLQAKENKAVADVIHLDIRKAFDTVPHHKLLVKLQKFGISGNLLRWFQGYLANRSQCVSIDNTNSNFLPVTSGVPQGSILGPLLFAIYINDLPEHLQHSLTLMFADDTKCIKLIHNATDCALLQTDIYHAVQWSSSCDLDFNIAKFIHMSYWNNLSNSSYHINHQSITLSSQCKDLGIIFTPTLNWSPHIDMIIARAYKILGLIRRTFHTNCIITKMKLYLSLVRSQLMYCSQLWRPNLIKDIHSLERVQRRATKYILNDYSSDYKTSPDESKASTPYVYLRD